MIGLKASLLEVCIFLVFVAGRMKQWSSDEEECMQIATPLKSDSRMNFTALSRFEEESEEPLSEERCEPTNIMGIGGFSSIKDKAAEV